MGVGKTTIGKQLASMLGLTFMDLDHIIELKHKKSVSEIFQNEGEAAFRGMERQFLREIIENYDNFLLSTGGGTPCFYENMEDMNAAGITIYLEMDHKSLAYRLQHAKEQRPLIKGMKPGELEVFVQDHLAQRVEFYREAKVITSAFGFNKIKLESLVDQVHKAALDSI